MPVVDDIEDEALELDTCPHGVPCVEASWATIHRCKECELDAAEFERAHED